MKTVTKIIANNMSEGLKLIRDQVGPEAMIVKTLKRRGKLELFVEYDSNEDREYASDAYASNEYGSGDGFEEARRQTPNHRVDVASGDESTGKEQREPGMQATEAYRQARARMLTSVVASAESSVMSGRPADPENTGSEIRRSETRENAAPIVPRDNIETFNSILRNVTEHNSSGERAELTVKGLIEDLQLHPRITTRLLDCRRIDEVVSRLQSMVNIAEETPAREGFHAFVGPAGGGKTTTLIKLVTRQVKTFGPESTAIIGCDNYRAGAMYQLGRMAKLLEVPFLRVGVDHTFEQAIARTSDRQFVAIDMPGLGLNDPDLMFELDRLTNVDRDISRMLVLPAYLQGDVMDLVLKRYSGDPESTRLILSRLDECCTLGPALSLLINTGLPLAYTTDGPHIPEDIGVATRVGIIRDAMQLLSGRVAKVRNSDFTNNSNEAVSQF